MSPSGSFCPRAVSDFLTGQVCTCSPFGSSVCLSLSFSLLLLSVLDISFARCCYSPFLSSFSLRTPPNLTLLHHPPMLPARNLFGIGILSLLPKVIRRSARWINRACRYIRPSKLFSNNPRRRHLELTYLN